MDVLNTKETITSKDRQLTEVLGTIETMKAEVKTLKDGLDARGSAPPEHDREARVEDTKPPIFKDVREAQEVENFRWHLENYVKCSWVRSDKNKINTDMLYLSEMAMLWWGTKRL